MKFFNRTEEMDRLNRLLKRGEGGLAVVSGRRRVGKTRLLLEWEKRNNGMYIVADQTTDQLQREYFATAVDSRISGFSSVKYPSWTAIFDRLTIEIPRSTWRGPLILDEFPYYVEASPEFASQLQRWIDHGVKDAGLCVALSGSSQRMMQGLILNHNAPLYGRANEILTIEPLDAGYLMDAFPEMSAAELVNIYATIGGIPRYWELASDFGTANLEEMIDYLILNRSGPLFDEPDRLLLEEIPSAITLRPLLDTIGMGAHKLSEIASRTGMQATSLSKPLSRLLDMGIVERELAFGESEKSSKRALYKIKDPFLNLWFKVIAQNKSLLTQSPSTTRITILQKHLPSLISSCWEDLCRKAAPRMTTDNFGPWLPAKRYWLSNDAEFDVLAQSVDNKQLLIGECKAFRKPASNDDMMATYHSLMQKGLPRFDMSDKKPVYALFVNSIDKKNTLSFPDVCCFDAHDVLTALR